MKCSGVYTALLTPFTKEGVLDEEGFSFLVQRQVQAPVDGLLVLGTTGESPTLSVQEKKRVIQIAKTTSNLPLMVGCGSNCTKQTIENIRMATELGADLALVVSPFYNKPTQLGLLKHFERISQQSEIPIILYNHPGRTGVNIEMQTLKELVQISSIIGIKETSGNLVQITQTIHTLKQIRPEFSILSGDDDLAFAVTTSGGDGAISGAANLIPTLMMELVHNDPYKARDLNMTLTPLFKALLIESNPIPLKAALQMCGLPSGEPRLPLTSLTQEHLLILEQALETVNLLAKV
ncbi:MAG: 4-hydroxy-tetrahydrodipicolinate synthase [Chlamydiales bacterium]|nr:4-hydroxy-tetrahydrodipicolinate synthase [Chlamydiales bacterium]